MKKHYAVVASSPMTDVVALRDAGGVISLWRIEGRLLTIGDELYGTEDQLSRLKLSSNLEGVAGYFYAYMLESSLPQGSGDDGDSKP